MKLFEIYIFLGDVADEKPEVPKKREMDEESSDNKKIKTDEKTIEVIEPEPVISLKEISSKKNVCTFHIYKTQNE